MAPTTDMVHKVIVTDTDQQHCRFYEFADDATATAFVNAVAQVEYQWPVRMESDGWWQPVTTGHLATILCDQYDLCREDE